MLVPILILICGIVMMIDGLWYVLFPCKVTGKEPSKPDGAASSANTMPMEGTHVVDQSRL